MAGRPRRSTDGAVPLEAQAAETRALGVGCRLRAMAPDLAGLRDGMVAALELLTELDRAWGRGGELDRLAGAPLGSGVPLSWDTVLLLGLHDPGGITVDIAAHSAVRTGIVRLPGLDDRHALAAELVLAELMESGCVLASVDVGPFRSTVNRGIRDPFPD